MNNPSDYFLGAILRGYDAERAAHPDKPVTPSAIWDQAVMECLRRGQGSFTTLFEWDTSRGAGRRNRIGTIAETIEAGLVPGLRLARDAKGRRIVEGESG